MTTVQINQVNNLIFCINKINGNGRITHKKNNILMKLYAIKKQKMHINSIINEAIEFIVKNNK